MREPCYTHRLLLQKFLWKIQEGGGPAVSLTVGATP